MPTTLIDALLDRDATDLTLWATATLVWLRRGPPRGSSR